MLIYPRSSLMASLTNSKHFTTSHHSYPQSWIEGYSQFDLNLPASSTATFLFFHRTLLPRHSLFENAKLSTIHLLLKIYPLPNDLQKKVTFPVSYSVFHSPDQHMELLNDCLWAVYFSGGYIICLSGSGSASSQSSFYLTFCIHPFLCIWILSKLLLKPSLTYALRIRLISSKSSHSVLRF